MVLSSYVGASVKRKEDPRLITGSSTYVDDIKLSGMAHVGLRAQLAMPTPRSKESTSRRRWPCRA